MPGFVSPTFVVWVVPSMITASVITGNAEASVIVCTPPPRMLKLIVSMPAMAFALMSAWRSEPAPLSLVLVTVNSESVPSQVPWVAAVIAVAVSIEPV